MVRTQIQLTEKQVRRLKELAHERNVSMAELIRRSVDNLLQDAREPTLEEKWARAMGAVGRFTSGERDLAREHDRYLDDAFGDFGS